MISGQSVVVVLPAYNAEKTLVRTVQEIPRDFVDHIILVDDASQDETVRVAQEMGLLIVRHEKNRGYGANQKTCYTEALNMGADIVIMLHPDYQYTPMLIPAMSGLVASGLFPVVLGSRILGGGALEGGMPLYKYIANRVLSAFQNLCTGAKLSEYHTGYRAYSAEVLRNIDFASNSDDFLFDNQVLAQVIDHGYRVGEITCPTSYFEEASSINLKRSVIYGLGVIGVSLASLSSRLGLYRSGFLQK